MNENDIVSLIETFEPRSMQNFYPIVWKFAKRDIVTDINNKKYIDFTSTIFVQNFGHSNPRVKKYLIKQIKSNLLHTYTFAHESRAKFLEKLINLCKPYAEKAFLLSSGTESTEAAVKLMRLYGKKINPNRKKIVSFEGAMHGRTMAASLMKHTLEYNHEDFIRLSYPTENSSFEEDIKNKINDVNDIAGVMIETYQGWSSRFMPIEYIKSLVKFCNEQKILVCFDEIQSGMFRCGTLFGFMLYDVIPDLVCIGKAIGGGLPLSAVIGRKEILDIPGTGDMSSTHSANPLCCAAGLAIVEEAEKIFKSKFYKENISIFGTRMEQIKNKYNMLIENVISHGMVGAIIFKDKSIVDDICNRCADKGLLLVHTGRESIKFGPPIVIKKKNLLKGFDIIAEVLNEFI